MTKQLMKKVLGLAMVLLILTPVFAFSLPALAEDLVGEGSTYWGNNGETGEDFADAAGLGNAELRTSIANVIKLVISFLGIVAVIIILIGGFKWMTAGGNEDKVGEAKKLIISGLIGLVVILMSYAIAAFVLNSLGKVTAS